jgi:methanogenic corrinoid protein MtbC1
MDELTQAIVELEEQGALTLVRERLENGEDALAILETCRQGMTLVGQRFQAGEYFISELIYSGAIFRQVAQQVEPKLAADRGPSRGAVVVGTVKGDIHDIGKDLVVLLLKASGYDVYDLGVDVSAHRFVTALQETGAKVLGLSALLTTAYGPMKETVAAVKAAGLRPGVKIMVGGGPVNERVRDYSDADAWGTDAQAAVSLCNQWIGDAAHGS